jgi:hypothetical protein
MHHFLWATKGPKAIRVVSNMERFLVAGEGEHLGGANDI